MHCDKNDQEISILEDVLSISIVSGPFDFLTEVLMRSNGGGHVSNLTKIFLFLMEYLRPRLLTY